MDSDAVSVVFLRTELETGITFAKLALSARDEGKIARNKANALKAYETALKFAERTSLDGDESALLDPLFEKLRSQLVELGQPV